MVYFGSSATDGLRLAEASAKSPDTSLPTKAVNRMVKRLMMSDPGLSLMTHWTRIHRPTPATDTTITRHGLSRRVIGSSTMSNGSNVLLGFDVHRKNMYTPNTAIPMIDAIDQLT